MQVMNLIRPRIVLALGALLCLGGMLEYVVVIRMYGPYNRQWTRVQNQLTTGSGGDVQGGSTKAWEKRTGSHEARMQSHSLRDEVLRQYLARIGREGMNAALQARPSSHEALKVHSDDGERRLPDRNFKNDIFYRQRELLFGKIDLKLAEFQKAHSAKKFEKDVILNDTDRKIAESEKAYSGVATNQFNRKDFILDQGSDEDIFQPSSRTDTEPFGPEILVENETPPPAMALGSQEAEGNNIMMTLRTMKKYHNKRLPLLFSTWLSKVNKSNVFLMTDDRDLPWQKRVWRTGKLMIKCWGC